MDQNALMLDYLMTMGDLQPQQQGIDRQRLLAQQLRQGGEMPGMQAPGRQGYAVAANPLQFAGALANQYQAKKAGDKADAMQDEYKKARMGAMGTLRTRMMPNGPGPANVSPTGEPLANY